MFDKLHVSFDFFVHRIDYDRLFGARVRYQVRVRVGLVVDELNLVSKKMKTVGKKIKRLRLFQVRNFFLKK